MIMYGTKHIRADLYSSSRELEVQVLPSLKPLADVELQAAFDFCHQGRARGQPHGRQPHLSVHWEGDIG